jgi:hypothetical protein
MMKDIFKVLCMSLLLGLSQAAWADEIGHGKLQPDPEAAPVETSDSGTAAEESSWLEQLLEWFDVAGSE